MYNHCSDTQLVALIRAGDIAAFRFLYDRYADKLLRIALAKLHNVADAEDCLQEVFAKFWNVCNSEKATLHHQEHLQIEAYLATAVRNSVFTFYKKELQKKLLHQLASQQTTTENAAEHEFNRRELFQLLAAELDAMPPQMRRIFQMSRDEGLTSWQIAEQLSLSEQTVKNQVTRALQRLRLRFGNALPLLFL